jgi:uncharacterized protein (TIGR02246 family)
MMTTIKRIARAGLAASWAWLGIMAGVSAQQVDNGQGALQPTAPRGAQGAVVSPSVRSPALSDRPADEQALKSVAQAYVRAYDAGDARSLGSLFTDDAEMIDENGERLRGRAMIENVLGTMFKERPGATITIYPTSLRFLGPDVAQEEGRTVVKVDAEEPPVTHHYTVTFVKQVDRWRYSSVREDHDAATTPHQHLEELAWLVGEWTDESPDSLVHTTCRWTDDGHFLLRDFTVRVQGKPVMTVNERIGWDASKHQIRSWVFDSEGGHGTGLWSRGAKEWVIKSTGILPDGRTATATHILTRVGPQSARWASVERTVGDRVVPDHAEYLMVRKPPRPQGR